MNGKSWIRGDWLGVIGIVIGLLGVGGSYYFYKLSEKEKEPILLLDPYRSVIVEAKSIKDFPLKVVDRDGKAVVKDVTSVRFYFWNEGRETIKRPDILKPIKLVFSSSDVEIIDYKILSSSRTDIVQPSLSLTANTTNSLDISFDILEKDDGFSAQIIFAGPVGADVEVKGTIEGVREIVGTAKVSSFHFYKTLLVSFGIPFIIVMASAVVAFFLVPWIARTFGDRYNNTRVLGLPFKKGAIFLFMFGVMLGMFGSAYFVYTKERHKVDLKVINSMLGAVPESIKPLPESKQQ